jgi:hypothetical protein
MDLRKLQDDPQAFRSALLIDTDAGPAPFSDVMDAWQAADFKSLDDGWRRCVMGAKQKAKYSRAWLERPRGHSKSQDLAIMSAWALFASKRRLSGIGAAGDQDQARILRDAVGRLVYVNPWMGQFLEVQGYRVLNVTTGSVLDIISSDAATSYGLTPDFIIADEVTHWRKRDLWDSLVSSAAKRASCMFVIIANAGLTDDWQWKARESIRTDGKWYFSRLEGPVASWITPDRLEEQERLLPGIAFKRLWLNEWTTGGGDALTPEDITLAFDQHLRPMQQREPGWDYVGGLDLGVSRDASALCILAIRAGVIRLAMTRIWRPTKGVKVDLSQVELAVLKAHAIFNLRQLCFDPWQAVHLVQRIQGTVGQMVGQPKSFTLPGHGRKTTLPLTEVPGTQKYLQLQATALIESFADRRVELFPEADLERDLRSARIEERGKLNDRDGTGTGFRIVFPRNSFGHGDLGQAFLYALLAASELAGKKKISAGVVMQGNPYDRFDRQQEASDRHNKKLAELGSSYGTSPFSPGSRSRLSMLMQSSGRFAAGRMKDPNIIPIE